MKLIEHLDSIDKSWRQHTIILLDNAPYHRSSQVQEFIDRRDMPIQYLGPYHFKMAPIEMFFAYIKTFDLNPLRTKLNCS